jgi:hypothetical protein
MARNPASLPPRRACPRPNRGRGKPSPTIGRGDCFAPLAMTCFRLHTAHFPLPTKRLTASLRNALADLPCGTKPIPPERHEGQVLYGKRVRTNWTCQRPRPNKANSRTDRNGPGPTGLPPLGPSVRNKPNCPRAGRNGPGRQSRPCRPRWGQACETKPIAPERGEGQAPSGKQVMTNWTCKRLWQNKANFRSSGRRDGYRIRHRMPAAPGTPSAMVFSCGCRRGELPFFSRTRLSNRTDERVPSRDANGYGQDIVIIAERSSIARLEDGKVEILE